MSKPEIKLYFRDQANGRNVACAHGVTVPRVSTLGASVSNLPAGWKGCVILSINDVPYKEWKKDFLYGGDDGKVGWQAGNYRVSATLHNDHDGKTPAVAMTPAKFKLIRRVMPTGMELHLQMDTPPVVVDPPKPDPKPVDPPKQPAGEVIGFEYGIACQINQSESPVGKMGQLYRDLGVRLIRPYFQHDWNGSASPDNASDLKTYKAAGFEMWPTLNCPSKPSSAQQTVDYYESVAALYGPHVKAIIVGNEPNLPQFFDGKLDEYVRLVLEPASKVLRARGIIVGGGALSEDDKQLATRALIDLGALDLVDLWDFHSYGTATSVKRRRLLAVRQLIGSKILIESESNCHMNKNDLAAWAATLPRQREILIEAGVSRAFYYRGLTKKDMSKAFAAWAALINVGSLTPREPFWSAFINANVGK